MNPFDSNLEYADNNGSSSQRNATIESRRQTDNSANFTIHEDSKEEDVSFNTRSNLFGGMNSPIQRLGGLAGSGIMIGSEDRVPSNIFHNDSNEYLRENNS